MKTIKNHARAILLFALALTLCLAACVPALASTGDRTLYRTNGGESGWYIYIQNVLASDDGIYVFLQNNSDLTILRFPDTASEPETYTLKEFYSYNYISGGDSSDTAVQTMTQTTGWVAWNGSVCAVQYNDIFDDGVSSVEGGWLRKLVLRDGEAVLEDMDCPRLDWTCMTNDAGQSSRWAYRIFTSGDHLNCVCYDDSGEEVVVSFDLTTGYAEEIPLSQSPQVYPAPNNSLLLSRYEWSAETENTVTLSLLDLSSQSEEKLGVLSLKNSNLQGVCADPENNRLIYSLDGKLLVAPDMDLTRAEAVNDSPPDYDMQMQVLPNGFILLWNSSAVAIRNTDPTQRSQFTLNILDTNSSENLDSAIYDFTNDRGDISVSLRRAYGDDSVLQAMMNRDGSVDIYCLAYESGAMDALRSRGFLADMSGDAEIAESFSRMYPWLQSALSQNGKITLVPTSLYGWTVGYDPTAWERLGFTEADLPTTWSQFFDLIEMLPEKTQGTEYQPLTSGEVVSGFRYSVMNQILQQYETRLSAQGGDYAFSTPLLKDLLNRLASMDYEALGLRESYDDEGFYDEETYRESVITLSTNSVIQSWNENYRVLPLALAEGEDPILPVNVTAAFVNPYSEHPAEAAAFLAASIRSLSVSTRYSCFTDQVEPVRYPDFEERKESTRKWLEEAQAELEKADEDSREEWENTVRDIEESLASMDTDDWMISPRAVSDYQAIAPFLRPLGYDIYSAVVTSDAVTGEYSDPLWQFAEGTLSAEELLSTIDKKVQMMRLEGN